MVYRWSGNKPRATFHFIHLLRFIHFFPFIRFFPFNRFFCRAIVTLTACVLSLSCKKNVSSENRIFNTGISFQGRKCTPKGVPPFSQQLSKQVCVSPRENTLVFSLPALQNKGVTTSQNPNGSNNAQLVKSVWQEFYFDGVVADVDPIPSDTISALAGLYTKSNWPTPASQFGRSLLTESKSLPLIDFHNPVVGAVLHRHWKGLPSQTSVAALASLFALPVAGNSTSTSQMQLSRSVAFFTNVQWSNSELGVKSLTINARPELLKNVSTADAQAPGDFVWVGVQVVDPKQPEQARCEGPAIHLGYLLEKGVLLEALPVGDHSETSPEYFFRVADDSTFLETAQMISEKISGKISGNQSEGPKTLCTQTTRIPESGLKLVGSPTGSEKESTVSLQLVLDKTTGRGLFGDPSKTSKISFAQVKEAPKAPAASP
jgi:hypothetical protein